MYICTWIYTCIWICRCISICIHICMMFLYLYIYIYLYSCIYVCVCGCMHVRIHVCALVYKYTYKSIHIQHTHPVAKNNKNTTWKQCNHISSNSLSQDPFRLLSHIISPSNVVSCMTGQAIWNPPPFPARSLAFSFSPTFFDVLSLPLAASGC